MISSIVGSCTQSQEPIIDLTRVCGIQDSSFHEQSLEELIPGLTDLPASSENPSLVQLLDSEQPVSFPFQQEPEQPPSFKEGDVVHIEQLFPELLLRNTTVTFVPPFDTQGTWQTSPGDAGTYNITLMLWVDNQTETVHRVVTVFPFNRPPQFTEIEKIRDLFITEGNSVHIKPTVIDPDYDAVRIIYGAPLNSEGFWETSEGDAGTYVISFIASDGKENTTEFVTLHVLAMNQPPLIEGSFAVVINESDLLDLDLSITDPENDPVYVSYGLPLNDEGIWQTDYHSAGVYTLTVLATDTHSVVSQVLTITVLDVNQPPTFVTER